MLSVEDLFGDNVFVGDTVIASRPVGAGTTGLEYCEVVKINPKSVSLRPIAKDGSPAMENSWNYQTHQHELMPKNVFVLTKAYGGRVADSCKKIVRH